MVLGRETFGGYFCVKTFGNDKIKLINLGHRKALFKEQKNNKLYLTIKFRWKIVSQRRKAEPITAKLVLLQ